MYEYLKINYLSTTRFLNKNHSGIQCVCMFKDPVKNSGENSSSINGKHHKNTSSYYSHLPPREWGWSLVVRVVANSIFWENEASQNIIATVNQPENKNSPNSSLLKERLIRILAESHLTHTFVVSRLTLPWNILSSSNLFNKCGDSDSKLGVITNEPACFWQKCKVFSLGARDWHEGK